MKKKIILQSLFALLFTMTLCIICKFPTKAYETMQKDGWTYIVNDNGEIEIQSYSYPDASATELVIPDTLEGKPVVSIHALHNEKLQKVTIGSNVKVIGSGTFHDCINLKSIDTMNVITVEAGAFLGCSSLKTAYLPKVTLIAMSAFNDCSSLETLYIPECTNLISNASFLSGCNNLKTIVMPKMQTIELRYDGTIQIPGSVTTVCMSDTAFANNKSTLPAGVQNHSVSWTTTKLPTVFQTGINTGTCIYCKNVIGTSAISKLKATIKLSKTSVSLKKKKSVTIKVSKLARGDSVKSWKSANKKIATVTSKGKITGKKKGKTTVTVTLKSGLKKKITVKIK